ncbi:MAG TPA: hypothetical protein P5319_06350 [Gemmatimonadales bacterium]|nr:hypothetical protein [Gemmatimonadales bacterium]
MRRLTLLALAAPLLLSAPLWAQEPTPATPPPMAGHAHAMGPATGAGGGCGGGGENCPCKAMMAKMDSANVQIADLTEKMNKASGSKKTEAMAALLNALVQDRLMMEGVLKMMHAHMEKQMMGGMGGMGAMGGMGGMGGQGACAPGADCCKAAGGAGCGAAAPAPAPKE